MPAREMEWNGIERAHCGRDRKADARARCLNTWRGPFEPVEKVHRVDGVEQNRASALRKSEEGTQCGKQV